MEQLHPIIKILRTLINFSCVRSNASKVGVNYQVGNPKCRKGKPSRDALVRGSNKTKYPNPAACVLMALLKLAEVGAKVKLPEGDAATRAAAAKIILDYLESAEGIKLVKEWVDVLPGTKGGGLLADGAPGRTDILATEKAKLLKLVAIIHTDDCDCIDCIEAAAVTVSAVSPTMPSAGKNLETELAAAVVMINTTPTPWTAELAKTVDTLDTDGKTADMQVVPSMPVSPVAIVAPVSPTPAEHPFGKAGPPAKRRRGNHMTFPPIQ